MAELSIQLLWALLSFILGALPFSVWVGRRAAGRDIREVGDKNPGATNVLRSAGFLWFTLAMVLDISKAAAPVGLAYQVFGWRGWPMWLIAMAPVLGHAFSPFLDWRGGKAVAAAFGAWIGLSIWSIPLVALLSLTFWFAMITVSGWAVILALFTILTYLVFFQPDPLLIAVAAGQLALMSFTHRADLGRRPGWRLMKRRSSPQS
jgi:acyl phosphate:glycerol-3-phosphate acyltransferase